MNKRQREKVRAIISLEDLFLHYLQVCGAVHGAERTLVLNKILEKFKLAGVELGDQRFETCQNCDGFPDQAPEVSGEVDPAWRPCDQCLDGVRLVP